VIEKGNIEDKLNDQWGLEKNPKGGERKSNIGGKKIEKKRVLCWGLG